MHFGSHIYTVLSPAGVLTVISPSDVWMICAWAACTIFTLGLLALNHTRPRSLVIVAVILLVILGLISSSGKIVLDATQNRVHIVSTTFFYPQTYDCALSSVTRADVASSDQADALRLVFNGGSDYQITPYNQMSGKGQAAFTINQYLQQHGGSISAQ